MTLLIGCIPSAALAAESVEPSATPETVTEKVPEDGEKIAAAGKEASEPVEKPSDAQEAMEEVPPEPIDGVARVIANFMRDELGLNSAATSAVLSVVQGKCSFQPNASYDGGTTFGICQWTGERLQSLKAYCGENSLDCNTVTAQLRFMKEELTEVYPELLECMVNSSNTDTGAVNAANAFRQYCAMEQQGITYKNPNSTENALSAESYFSILSEEKGQEKLMSVMTAEIIAADFLRNEMGFNNAVTAGIMANMYDESGFKPDTLGDGGTAYGLCQWGPLRRGALERFCKYNSYDVTTIGAQLFYLKIELETDFPSTLELLLECEDNEVGTREAARLFCKNYEVPASLSKQVKERQKLAEKMYFPMLNGEEYERFPVDEILKDNNAG